jgi:hypothetical protein
MPYEKHEWSAREGTGLNRFVDQNGNEYYFTSSPTEITREGTPFSADWMNHIENGIANIMSTGSNPTEKTQGALGKFHITSDGALWYCAGVTETGTKWFRLGTVNSEGKIPAAQIPTLPYIYTKDRGAANGVASLDDTGKIPATQIPALPYIPAKEIAAASGVASLDENAQIPAAQIPLTHKELCRFTASGTFKPADHPTRDGLYTIVLQGAGGGGSSVNDSTGTNTSVQGGGAGGFAVIGNVPLDISKTYTVTVGTGGIGSTCGRNKIAHTEFVGEKGGDTSFDRFKVPGGNGGDSNSSTEIIVGAYVAENGDIGTGSNLSSSAHCGGSSLFGEGGKSIRTASANGNAGGIGAGGGAVSCSYYGNAVGSEITAGSGGDGLVIIYGIPE